MSVHAWLDKAVVSLGGLYGDSVRFFREGVQGPALPDAVAATEVAFEPQGPGREQTVPVGCGSIEATTRVARIHWEGPDRPTLIFHHGSGEHAYTRRLARTIPAGCREGVNLLAISAPFNEDARRYLHGVGSLRRFVFMLAASVRTAEAVRVWLVGQGCVRTVLAGISLGGWVTNLHAACFASMTSYRPIFAGAALDDLFVNTPYRKLLASGARSRAAELSIALNFEDRFVRDAPRERVHALLARFDQFIRFPRQRGIYLPGQVRVLEKGHVTGSLDTPALRAHLIDGLSGASGRPGAPGIDSGPSIA